MAPIEPRIDRRDALWRGLAFLRAQAGPFAGLALVLVFFGFLTGDLYLAPLPRLVAAPKFLTSSNLSTVLVQTATIAMCGIGMTLIIIAGGIDLSVGSGVALVMVVVALVFNGEFYPTLVLRIFRGREDLAWSVALLLTAAIAGGGPKLRRHGFVLGLGGLVAAVTGKWIMVSGLAALAYLASTLGTSRRWWALLIPAALWLIGWGILGSKGAVAAILAGVAMGALCGSLNGWLVTTSRIVPFIVTLGTMEIFRGVAQRLAGETVVNVDRQVKESDGWLFALMQTPPPIPSLQVAIGVWVTLIVGVFMTIVLRRTPLGRYTFAIGSNEEAARLSGVPVDRMKWVIYTLAGGLMGAAGVMNFTRVSAGLPTDAVGLELDVIAAVVIGGGSLRGGEGSVFGTFQGALIMGLMRNACDLALIPNSIQRVLIGVIIIVAVTLDEIRNRRARR